MPFLSMGRPRRAIPRVASAAGLAALLMLAAALARAQDPCVITGPDVICGGTVTLCGPDGFSDYNWIGPGGTIATGQCITVSAPGSYSLRFFDSFNNVWDGPCFHDLASAAPACSISGPTSACSGTPIQLCGPTGNLSYSWSGPNSFSSTSACISVTTAGSYTLVITDMATGCASAPSSQDVSFTTCGGDPPPHVNCPRPVWFWARQCWHGDDATINADRFASVAACVDQHSDLFSWPNETDGFCATLHTESEHSNLRAHAKRQMAALDANLCAEAMQLTAMNGAAIGVDPAAVMGSTTVGQWHTDAEAQMMSLESQSLHDHAVREAYRAIIRGAWNINHGHGIGPVCNLSTPVEHHDAITHLTPIGAGSSVGGNETGSDVTDVNSNDAAEPLEAELSDNGAPELVINRIMPNPATDHASIAYELIAPSSQPVSLGVYDLAGRKLRDLVVAPQAPGIHQIDWDGRDSAGHRVAGGGYFIHGLVGGQPVQSRLTLVR